MARQPECKKRDCGNPSCSKHRFSKKSKKKAKRSQAVTETASRVGMKVPKTFTAKNVRTVVTTAFETKRRKH